MEDLTAAQREKQTDEHCVIDDCYNDQASVSSQPVYSSLSCQETEPPFVLGLHCFLDPDGGLVPAV